MVLLIFRYLLVIALLAAPAQARFPSGARNPIFTAANWSGYTIKNFITDYGATCNGIADDSPALASWVTAGVAQNPGKIVLYIPPGSTCHFPTNNALVWDGSAASSAIQNAVIWAYGASVDITYIGGAHFYADSTHEGLIQTAGTGSSTVTLVTSGDSSRFAIGDKVLVGGLALQNGGYPPNLQFYEYSVITNISTPTITLSGPLANSYKSTWPLIDTLPTQGPATLYKLQPSWDNNTSVYGLTINSSSQVPAGGTTIFLLNTIFSNAANLAPTGVKKFIASYSALGGPEVDKEIELAVLSNSSASVLTVQSPVNQLTLDNFTVTTSMNGQGTNVTMTGGNMATAGHNAAIGPVFYGHGNNLSLNGTAVVGAQLPVKFVPNTSLSFSAGTYTILRTDPLFANLIAMAVPGFSYFLGCSGEAAVPATNFKITDVRGDATHVFVDTDMPSLPVTPPQCSGSVNYTGINSWAYETIIQTNSPGGSVSLSGYAP